MLMKLEELARQSIDAAPVAAGWVVQDMHDTNLYASSGVAVRELSPERGYGFADYLLFVDGQAVGAIEAKKQGTTLTGVEIQSAKYGDGLPAGIPAPHRPLPFVYESTGIETRFTNRLDPEPRSRRVFNFHKPQTLGRWASRGAAAGRRIAEDPEDYEADSDTGTRTFLRQEHQNMSPPVKDGLWPAQIEVVKSLEESLKRDNPGR